MAITLRPGDALLAVDGKERLLYVHRKGATRAFGPGHPALPARYREAGASR